MVLKTIAADILEPKRRTASGKIAKKRGRKPKTKKKADATVVVYMTSKQKKVLLSHCEKSDVAVSILLKEMLIEKKIIPSE